MIVKREIFCLVEIRVLFNIGLADDLEVALHQQHQQFNIGVQEPFGEFAAAAFIQQQQPINQAFIIQTVLAPTVKVQHVTYLLRSRQGKQIHGILDSNLFDRVQERLRRQRPYEVKTVRCRKN